ncbi:MULTISPECIES: hypothetical protein [unclassified Frankia]|uniref:hypothetical protein n=1 Tax=unclassified Frankia TaxID=2632575 RepID=UPI001EF5C995|nr:MULTISPECIES: hypothetical protein [unclassified Frankia]
MAEKSLSQMLTEVEEALRVNREGVAEIDRSIAAGNRILQRRTTLVALVAILIAVNICLTVALTVFGVELNRTQQAANANACNLNALFTQSIATSGNTVDLYRGLRPLIAANHDPDSQRAVAFIDRSVANLESNAKIRADFLTLTRNTAKRLHCQSGFVSP